MWDTVSMPTPEVKAEYRRLGWWRDRTFLDDVRHAAATTPDKPAIIGYHAGKHDKTLTYAALACLVERFAAALTELGVGAGDVVVIYLPNRWMLGPLYLACARIGAVSAPVLPALAGRELAHVLRASRAAVCVTVDTFNDVDYATRIRDVAPDTLRHRVVVGDAARTNAIDFTEFFVDTPWEARRPAPPLDIDADAPALLLFTSGTTGAPKGVVHTHNTLYASARSVSEPFALGADEVVSIPSYLTHMAGASYAVYMPMLLGASCVMQDTNTDMELLLDLVAEHRVTFLYAAPVFALALLAGQRARPRDTASLRRLVSGSAPVPPQLVADVKATFGIPMFALWGMTENGAVTVTRPEDPEGWAAHSDGSPEPWMRLRIDAEPGTRIGRLLVQGANQCLGYLHQPDVYAATLDADGWFDTGDLARDDGRGGIRITGRRVDLITRGSGAKIPTLEVEALLLRHPRVAEVVLIGYPDPDVPGSDLACAAVVPRGVPPTRDELCRHLEKEQMSSRMWPDRVEIVAALPKNSLGKVLRHELRAQLDERLVAVGGG